VGRRSDGDRRPLDVVFLVTFDQFIVPEEVMKTIGIYAGTNIKWEKAPAPYAPLRMLERDSAELLAYVAFNRRRFVLCVCAVSDLSSPAGQC
jgi:hypothetical protein